MENKKIRHSYNGMNRDTTKSQFPQNFYFEGSNIRIVTTDSQSTGSVTNEKGNSLILTIPIPIINHQNKTISYNSKVLNYTTNELVSHTASGLQKIIGNTTTRDDIILFTTDDTNFDCIWKVDYLTYDITLLYLRDLNFSTSRPIQALNNFENKIIDKVYWVDGVSQLRSVNIKHSIANKDFEELIDVSVFVIDSVGRYDLSEPKIVNVTSGGSHTAGMIQYGYNLYRLNGAQTKISSLSKLIPLDKGSYGGGAVNESVGFSPIVRVENIDLNYTNIRIYSIKYTSYNLIPVVSLIADRTIPVNRSIEIFDDGLNISTLSLEEFIFLGSDIIVPKNMNSKNNRLFLANYKELNFEVNLDTRAYGFPALSSTTVVHNDLFLDNGNPNGVPFMVNNTFVLPETHDAVNLNYNLNRYQRSSLTVGGEGKYLKYSLIKDPVFVEGNKYFKDDEIYRIGIEFYNIYGQVSLPKWIADFKAPNGNLSGTYNTLSVELKSEFITWILNDLNFNSIYDKPVGFKLLAAERTLNDKTIVANGFITPMMVNYKTANQNADSIMDADKTISDELPKMPNILARNCSASTIFGKTKPLERCSHLKVMNQTRDADTEIQRANTGDNDTAGRFYQFNSLMQMYSPEVMFGQSTSLPSGLNFKVKGLILNTDNNSWGRIYNTVDSTVKFEGKAIGGLSSIYSTTKESIIGNVDSVYDDGLIAHDGSSDPATAMHTIFSRNYSDVNNNMSNNASIFTKPFASNTYQVYGKPEFTEKGQSFTTYNNDPKYRYVNSLESFLSDGNTGMTEDGLYGRKIISVNSYGNKCLTFALDNTADVFSWNRTRLESLFNQASPNPAVLNNQGVIGEFVKPESEIYLGNIYGGNNYEVKKRTNYISIGEYVKINSVPTLPQLSITIKSPGDTFVRNFKFLRITNTDKSIISEGVYKYEEIIDVLCETTVDLKNRNDLSINDWDSKFQYIDEEYHKYNTVYSQSSSLIRSKDLNYNTKKVNNFDTNIISSKVKSSGELIDSWTDFLQNEVLTLDGKFGSINILSEVGGELYALQDQAFAFISINPRVQVQGSDGIDVELGSGNALQEYRYKSTTSGTINKWSVVSTPRGLYYYDLLNKSFMVFQGELGSLSDTKSMHSYFVNNTGLDQLKTDNPLLKQGISAGYDQLNNEIFMTFHKNSQPFTISYNELKGQFVSFYDYLPSIYISRGQHFITTSPDSRSIYKQYEGEYNRFYGQYYPSYIVLSVNPEADLDTVFDNIMYKSEIYLNNIDQPDKSLTHVQLYNEYQNSGLIPLVIGRNGNLRRKFRDWNAILPRNANTRQRIRNPWVFLKLQLTNNSNYKMILHDVIISYSV